MRHLASLSVVVVLVGCGAGADQRDEDTTLGYTVYLTPTAADSARAPSRDSVIATLMAYDQGRIPADSAAQVIVNYMMIGQPLNADFDNRLQRAIQKELRHRSNRR